jgi:hypothetical protein
MYDTLLMWKDPPPPSPKLIEGPKEDSFSQVMNDTLLLWKTPHSPHRRLRIEDSQRRLHESDSCASSRYSHISAESSSKFSNASTKGPNKSACRNALEQLQKKQKRELPTTENPFQSEAMMRLYDRDDESHKLLGKRNRSVSSLGDSESIVSFSSTDFPITSAEGSHNAIKESFILEKPFTTLPVPTSLDLGAIQGLQVTAPPVATPQADFSTTFAQFLPKGHAQGISSACMQDRDKIVKDKVIEIKMKKNLYNEGRSGKTGICLSPEATAFLDNRAADHSVPFEDPPLLKLAAELDSLRSRLSTSENGAVSKFVRSIGEGIDIDEATVLTLTSHASTLNDQSEMPPMTNTPEIALLCEATVRNESSSSSTQIDAEDLGNENVDTDKEQNVTSLTQDPTACSPEETLTWSSNDIESPVETSEVKSVKTPAEARKERLVTLMSTFMKTPAEARKERLVSLMSKLANMNTETEEESDRVHESKGGENPSLAIAHISDDEESTHASSLCSKQDDVASQNERNHIAVTCQNSFVPTLETAMSLISFAAVDPTASTIEENECPDGDEEMYPTANAIESCSTEEEYQVAPALDTTPSSISFGTFDHNPSMISFGTTDVAPLTIEPGEGQIDSSSRKTPDNLYGKVEQSLPLPETTKTAQLPSLVPTVAKSSGAVSSISKTRAGSLRPSTVGTVKSILKDLVTGDQPDLDTIRALIIKSKAPRLNQEEIMTEAMSWSAAGKADPINILLKDMELYAVHEKLHYGELSSAGVFLIQSSDVIRSFIDDQKRSSKTLQIADPVLCHEAQKKSDISDDIQGPFCGNNNETTQYTAGSNVVSQDFSSSKPSDDPTVDSAPSVAAPVVAAPVVAAASTVNPSFAQEASPVPDPINVNSLMTNQYGVDVRAPGQDRRLPKPPTPELQAARFADSESEKRSRSISLTEADLDTRLPKSKAPSPESEVAMLTDSDSEKQEQPVSLADAGPDKKLSKASLPESEAARFADTGSQIRKQSSSLTEAGLDMRLPKSKAPSPESEAEKLTDSDSEKRKQSISLADASPNKRLPKTPLPESEAARSANSGSQIRKQSSSMTDAGADKRLSKHPSPESEAEKLTDSDSEKREQPVSLADAGPDKKLSKAPLPESEAARFLDTGSQIRKQSSSLTDVGAHMRLSKHPSPESEAEKLTDSGSEKRKQSISLADASPDKILPKTSLPESEAAAFADSGSQIRKHSSSLTDAGADKRLSKHPSPESEAEKLTDSDSEKREQPVSLADAGPDKKLSKPPLPESEAARFADTGSQIRKQSRSLTDKRLSKHPSPESEAEKLTDSGSEKRKQSISLADASQEKRQPKTTLPSTRFADSGPQRQKQSNSLIDAGTHKKLPKAPSPESETDRFTDSGSQRRKQSNSLSGLVTELQAVKKARPKIEVHDSKETEGGASSTKDTWPNLRDRVTAPVPWDGKKDEVSTDLAPPKKNGHIALSSVVMKLKTTPMQSYRKDKAITPPASSEISLDESKPASSVGSASLEAVVMKMKMATGAALSREKLRQQTVRM